MFDVTEIREMFDELANAECDGYDIVTYTALQTVDRWADYEADRKEWRESCPAFKAKEEQRWAKANVVRKRKRRGIHLSNKDRLRLIESGMSPEEISAETKCSVAVARGIGQMTLGPTFQREAHWDPRTTKKRLPKPPKHVDLRKQLKLEVGDRRGEDRRTHPRAS